jgi:hypothetical protein
MGRSALFGRAESKDFVDLYFVSLDHGPLDALIAAARQKHGHGRLLVGSSLNWILTSWHDCGETCCLGNAHSFQRQVVREYCP